MKNATKLLALLLALVMCVGAFAACGNQTAPATEEPAAEEPAAEEPVAEEPAAEEPAEEAPAGYEPSSIQLLNGKEYGVDYTSLYDQFGKEASIADVDASPADAPVSWSRFARRGGSYRHPA